MRFPKLVRLYLKKIKLPYKECAWVTPWDYNDLSL